VLSLDAIHPDGLSSRGNEVRWKAGLSSRPGSLSVNIFIKSSEIIDFINMDDNASQIPSPGKT
jgi:hypothetical protein